MDILYSHKVQLLQAYVHCLKWVLKYFIRLFYKILSAGVTEDKLPLRRGGKVSFNMQRKLVTVPKRSRMCHNRSSSSIEGPSLSKSVNTYMFALPVSRTLLEMSFIEVFWRMETSLTCQVVGNYSYVASTSFFIRASMRLNSILKSSTSYWLLFT